MDSIEKKVLIEIDLDTSSAKATLEAFKNDLDNANSTINLNATALKAAKVANQELADELVKGKIEQQNVKTAIDKARLAQIEANAATKAAKGAVEAASGSYKEAQQALTKLGNTIRTAKDGFTSTSPAIQAQIKEYNELNAKLKAFDETMGNHQRKVGSYTEALAGINGVLGRLVPGFSQFSGILQQAAQGFNAMGTAATESTEAITATGSASEGAEAGMAGAGTAAFGLSAGLAAIAAAAIGVYEYFKDVSTFSDRLSNDFAGLKAAWVEFANEIRNGDFQLLAQTMNKASDKAKELNQEMIDLSRNMLVSDVESNQESQFISTQMLKMRNLHTTAAEAEDIFKQVQDTANKQYERVSQLAFQGYQNTANKIALSAKLTQDELTALMRDGVTVAESFKADGKHISDDLIRQFADFQKMIDSAEGLKDQIEQRAQNREDQKAQKEQAKKDKDEAKAERDAEKAAALVEKEQQELAKIKQETDQAESERIASLTRTLNFQRTAFAKELSDTDEHYRQLIFKQQEFIAKQQQILKNPKSTGKERSAATGAISTANGDISQLTAEKNAAQTKLLQDRAKVIQSETEKAANDLATIQIASIDNEQERERQAENLAFKEKTEAYNKQIELSKENQEKLTADIKKATPERARVLSAEYEHEAELQAIANDKQSEAIEAHQRKQLEDIKKFADQKQALEDQATVLQAKQKSGGNENKEVLAAEQKELQDQYNAEVSAKGLTDAKKLELEAEYLAKRDALNKQYDQARKAQDIQVAEQVASAAFSIISQSLARQNQAQEVNMQKQQAHDLQNTALTNTQKYEIEEKYRVKAGQQKVKEFHQEQEIALAKGAIDTAAAILKASPDIPLMILAGATGALELGVIASEKAPAYAMGGVHYVSDGTGGVLPGYSKTDNLNAHLRSGEGIVVSEAMQNPWARSVVSAINQSWGGRAFDNTVGVSHFASGGVFNNYLPTSDNGLRPQIITGSTRMHGDDIGAIVGGISSAIASAPAPIVDVKDVNYANSRLSGVYDRLNY